MFGRKNSYHDRRTASRRRARFVPVWIELPVIGVAAFALVAVGAAFIWASLIPIPSINNFENRKVAESTKIYDRTGNVVLYDVHGAMRRTAVPLEDISPYIQHATISIEDATFYTHHGFRPLAFLRAALVHLRLWNGYAGQGGSTITQQVVKNALLTQDKTIIRKLEEIVLAIKLERVYSKDQILSTYLNENPYGGTIYGVQEASQYYFGVDAKDVDLAQAAYLAALPQAPTYYSPYGNHRDALDARKNLVLSRMEDLGYITKEEKDAAQAESVQFRDESEAGIKAPHFVFYIREYLEQKYGVDAVNNGGLRVITTLDYDLQQKAEATVAKFAPQMLSNFNASNEGLVAIDPKTGQILAMVGSKGYFDPMIDGKFNVALAPRQPGSSFKPFVYATALEKGYTPDTVVYDVKTQFSTACSPHDILNDTPPCYSPDNFDGKFKGAVTFRDALAQSINIPAIKALYLAGIPDSLKTAQDLGITTLGEPSRYGLTLVLGGGEVNLLEMTGAYAVFANDGVRNPPTGVLRIEDKDGNVLESYQDVSARVLDAQIAREINDMLSDNVARTPEFGADSPLNFSGYNVADKTGTTNDYHDVWILGYTPGISVGAWAGNNDNEPMAKKISAYIIAPMWHDFMLAALAKYSPPDETFTPPAPETDTSLPPVLAGNGNTDPSLGIHSILYWVNKGNPRTGRPANPQSDPQFAYWDYAVAAWAGQQGLAVPGAPSGQTTETTVSEPTSNIQGGVRILSPKSGGVVPFGSPVTFTAMSTGATPIVSVLYYLNGALIGQSSSPPYSVTYSPATAGGATVRAVGLHPDGSREEQAVTFTIK